MTEDGNEAAVAVVGAQLRYSKFYDLFINTTKQCSSSSNEVLCHELCRNEVSELHCCFVCVMYTSTKQESLADAKVSARQQCLYEGP